VKCLKCKREYSFKDLNKIDDITINQLDDDPNIEVKFYCPNCEEEIAFVRIHEDDLIIVDY